MKNKYYTPALSEFHVGFEYELYTDWDNRENTLEWRNVIFDGSEFDPEQSFVYLFDDKGIKRTRVKHLDSEDLEDLEFAYYKKGFFKSTNVYKNDSGIEVWLMDNYFVNIYLGFSKESKVFSGQLQNKSELKQVLNMIGVEYEK